MNHNTVTYLKKKNLLNAGKSPYLGNAYELFLIFISIIYVKIAMTWRKSAGVRSISTSETSQRLHAGDLSEKVYYINSYLSSLNIHPYPLSGIRGGGLFPFFFCLFGPRRGFQTKSNLFARGFSSTSDLSPSYVSGFSDGEYSFHVSVLKKKAYKTGFQLLPIITCLYYTVTC